MTLKPPSGLVTFLATDVEGATRLLDHNPDAGIRAAALGDRAWKRLLASHHAFMREYLPRFRGREVRTTGDGILAAFNTPTQAIECAIALCDAVRGLGMQIRAGIHTGECELIDNALEGVAVHLAARVSAIAGGSEILVSRTVTKLVVGSGPDFVDRGSHVFKGVPGEWHAYAVANRSR
jgi:class 3 adenylate cyclase